MSTKPLKLTADLLVVVVEHGEVEGRKSVVGSKFHLMGLQKEVLILRQIQSAWFIPVSLSNSILFRPLVLLSGSSHRCPTVNMPPSAHSLQDRIHK